MVGMVVDASVAAGQVTMDPDHLDGDERTADVDVRPRLPASGRQRAVRTGRAGHPGPRRVVRRATRRVPDAYRLHDSTDLQAAVDYVAGMSDKYAMRLHDERFRPAGLY